MKRLYTLLYILATVMPIFAQPSAVKKAAKGVLKVTTFKADGTLMATGYGAFIDENGTAIAAWTPFIGASSAVVIDGQGKKYDVDCIYGASEIYDVARLKVKKEDKASIYPLTIEQGQQTVGTDAWFVNYDVKAPLFTKTSPAKVETFMGNLPYYIIEQEDGAITDRHTGSPFLNAKGELMGLTKTSTTRTDLYVASARFVLTLQPSALSANDNTLRRTGIRIALPTDYNQALLAMMIASQRNDSVNYPATVEDFITMFPDKEDGYEYKATILTDRRNFAEAETAMQKAIEASTTKDNAHYFYAKLIYNKELAMPDVPYANWSLDKALAEADAAIAANPLPLYRVMKGQILFSQTKYQEAFNEFNEANKTEPRNAEVYYYSYQCLRNMKAERAQQLEMLDSAIVLAPKQLLYLSEKALLLMKMNRASDAISVAQQAITIAPQYAEGHGLLGLALCMTGNKPTGIAELKRAKALGYPQADAFLATYDKQETPDTKKKK